MKAAVYYGTGGPEVLVYEDFPDPVCGPGDVLMRTEAISIEGGDTLNRASGEMVTTPHVVGYQSAGTIVEVGADVTDRVVGERVVTSFLWGSHAELRAVPAAVAWPVPEGADLVAIACVPIAFGTADACLFEFGHLRPGETVLVQAAAGGVGIAAIQLAKRAGATVIATASSDARLEQVRHLGIDHPVNYADDGWVDAVRRATGGRGVDLAVDCVGGRILAGSAACLTYRGRLISVGGAGRDPQPFDVSLLSAANLSLTGVFLGAEITNPRIRSMIADRIADVASGALEAVVDRTYPLTEAADAHAYIESRRAVGRVVLVP